MVKRHSDQAQDRTMKVAVGVFLKIQG